MIKYFFLVTSFSLLSADYTVVLDPGHGGIFQGCQSIHETFFEKNLTLEIATHVAHILKEQSILCVMTRTADKELDADLMTDLAKRVEQASRYENPLFVSIHLNSSSDPSAKGFELYVPRTEHCPVESYMLASCIHHQVSQQRPFIGGGNLGNLNKNDRGIRAAHFIVLAKAQWPACLVECDFLSNPLIEEEFKDNETIKKCARYIAQGIVDFINCKTK